MKINRLRLAGFGPYKDEQIVDFTRFDDDGIFLISGKTGAGKSSILDAICYGLYNTVPRYDNRQSKLRSDHCEPGDPSFVEVDFTMGDAVYRVRRSPDFDRPKRRGEGVAKAPATAELQVLDADGWRGLAARPVDVARELSRILPIRADQFLQVILLAQNRFQRFLLAQTDERRAVLRTLFGTVRFDDLEMTLADRSRRLATEVEGAQHEIRVLAENASTLLTGTGDAPREDRGTADDVTADGVADAAPAAASAEWFASALSTLEERCRSSDAAATLATTEWQFAADAVRAAEQMQARQDRRTAASVKLAVLDERATEIDDRRTRVAAAARAARAWPHVLAHRAAIVELETALSQESLARRAWMRWVPGDLENQVEIDVEIDVETGNCTNGELELDSLQVVIDNDLTRLGSLFASRSDERCIPVLERRASSLEISETEAIARVERLQLRATSIPAELEALSERMAASRVTAVAIDSARDSSSRLAIALEGAEKAAKLERAHARVLVDQKAASSANTAAAAAYDDLLDRRLTGHAAELATALIAGLPCSVCGSLEHPAPTESVIAPVTETDVAEANAARIREHEQLAAVDLRVQSYATDLAMARGIAGGVSLDDLTAQLATARTDMASALLAAEAVTAGERHRIELVGERDALTENLTDVTRTLDTVRTAHAEQRAILVATRERITHDRGRHASVAERMSRLEERLDAARAVAAALERSQQRAANRDTAAAALDEQLVELGFTDESVVEAGRLSAPDIAAIEQQIQAHDHGRAAATSTLSEVELADLPSERIDLTPPTVRLTTASSNRDQRISRAHDLAVRRDQLVGTVARADALLSVAAGLIGEHGRVRELAEVVAGSGSNTKRIRLETYVLAARLEDIIAAANVRLTTMTSSRYLLELDDERQHRNLQTGLGLNIRDAHTGRARATHSLSGGETFLASLALALGLAEVVSNQAGGIALDTLFVDEGFGSLDNETLDVAMSTLDSLRTGGRTVGLISHVDSMKEQIPAKLEIEVSAAGHSTIRYGSGS